MQKNIYELLKFIQNNNKFPTCEELNISQERLNKIVKKCNDENLLDKSIIFVNILGTVNYDDDPELAITINGIKFLEEYNPLGKLQ